MRRNIHVMYKNFRGIVLTKTLLGFEGRLNLLNSKKNLRRRMLNVHWLWAGACTSLMRLLNSHRHRLLTFMTVLKN